MFPIDSGSSQKDKVPWVSGNFSEGVIPHNGSGTVQCTQSAHDKIIDMPFRTWGTMDDSDTPTEYDGSIGEIG